MDRRGALRQGAGLGDCLAIFKRAPNVARFNVGAGFIPARSAALRSAAPVIVARFDGIEGFSDSFFTPARSPAWVDCIGKYYTNR
jgi:hypothetical protein